jgi:hypothetical protein
MAPRSWEKGLFLEVFGAGKIHFFKWLPGARPFLEVKKGTGSPTLVNDKCSRLRLG